MYREIERIVDTHPQRIAIETRDGVTFSYRDVEKTLLALTKDQDYRPDMRILFIDADSGYNPPKHESKSIRLKILIAIVITVYMEQET